MGRAKPWFKKALLAWAILVVPGFILALTIDWRATLYGYFFHITLDDPVDFVADLLWKAVLMFPIIGAWFGIKKTPPDNVE
jgi:hypothetical protein